jgi:hypothetical protein
MILILNLRKNQSMIDYKISTTGLRPKSNHSRGTACVTAGFSPAPARSAACESPKGRG